MLRCRGRGRFEESLGDLTLLGPVGVEAGAALSDVLAGAAGELADRLLLTPEDVGDLRVGIPNASLRTNTALSSGESVSSTTSIAIEMDSAITVSSAGSCRVRMGSGSQGPT